MTWVIDASEALKITSATEKLFRVLKCVDEINNLTNEEVH